jgi:hypothetical protein
MDSEVPTDRRPVELRIQGVGGASAPDIINATSDTGQLRVVQRSGDAKAGFYRPASGPGDRILEAYEWGRLTSGPSSSALWWIALPFSLINVAGWMFEPTQKDPPPEEKRRSLLWWGRLLAVIGGLMLSVLFTMWVLLLALDMHAIECGSDEVCPGHGPLVILRLFQSDPMWLVAVGAAASVMIVTAFLLWLQGSQKLEGYELDPEIREADASRGGARLRRNTRLQDGALWYQWSEYRRQWRWHLAAVFGTVGFFIGSAYRRLHIDWGAVPGGTRLASAFLAIGSICGAICWLHRQEMYQDPANRSTGEKGWRALLKHSAITALFAGLTAILGWALRPPPVSGTTVVAPVGGTSGLALSGSSAITAAGGTSVLPPVDTASTLDVMTRIEEFALAYVLLGLMLLAVIATRWCRSGHSGFKARFRYAGPVVLGALAPILAGAGFGGLSHIFSILLFGWNGRAAHPGFETVLPEIVLIAVLAVAGVSSAGLRWPRHPRGNIIKEYFPELPWEHLSTRERDWVDLVGRKRKGANRGAKADWSLTLLIGVMIALWLGHLAARIGTPGAHPTIPWHWNPLTLDPPLFGWHWLAFLHTIAALAIVLFVFPGVWLIRNMLGDRSTRRQLGKVWDVVSFWPRRFHAFAAPCYGERAVPEFRDRIAHHLAKGRRVVISAHSQGTVVAYAALKQLAVRIRRLPDPSANGLARNYTRMLGLESSDPLTIDTRKVALVTFGCPLTQLYAKAFPSHFDRHWFEELRGRLSDWDNYYRPTDYIGKRVFIEYDEATTEEPCQTGQANSHDHCIPEAARALLPPELHSNYERELAIKTTIAELLRDTRRQVAGRRWGE